MITLTYYSKTQLDIIASIPEQWREYVTQNKEATMWCVAIQVQPDDSSYRYRALMQKPQLVLKFSLPFYFEFPVGTSCVFQNQRFILTRAQDLKKQGTRKIEYTMTLGTNEDFFGAWKIRNVVDHVATGAPKDNRLKFSLCAKPHEFIDLIVRNLNEKDTSITWERGECLEASEKTVEFNHTYIDDGLTDICNVFQTEYEVEYIGTTRAKIHLRRVEYFKTEPVALSYGCGNGFIPGVGRTSEADGVPVKRMLVQGSDRNIDRAKYGSPELLLPKSQTIRYDGAHFEGEDGFNSAIARTYQSNADGDGVERIDKVSDAVKEDSIDCSEIYPSRIGEVTSVEVENAKKNFYNIIDNTIPDKLNYNNYLIAGETMTIIFQDGMLAGKEFDVRYKHERRKFEIVPQEIDGVIMPDKTWCPVKEQTYAIFGIQLPDEYICNNTNKSGGSWDMMRAAVKALYECEDQRFTFSGTLQSLWAKRHWLEVGGKLIVGGHVLFQDEQFAKDGVVIRIVGIKDFINAPYSPTIEISNSVSGGSSVSSQLRQITNTEVVIDDTEKRIMQFTKRRFRDAKETIEMLEDAQLDMFTNAISPIAVQAMSLLVGDESLQFQFVAKSDNQWVKRTTPVYWDNEKKQLSCQMTSDGMNICLQHLTIGHDAITTKERNDAQGYLTWNMNTYLSPVLTDASAKYYLYAKCPKDTNLSGSFVLSQTSIRLDEVSNHYHFLVGLLNAEIDGTRSFAPMHGFTEILPGRITTDNIVSSDGLTFIDLLNCSFHVGNEETYIDWNNVVKGSLNLKNANISLFNKSGRQTLNFNADDGSGFLSCGKLSWTKDGDLILEGFVKPAVMYITEDNFEAYMHNKIDESGDFTVINKTIDFTRTGGLVHVLYWPEDYSSENLIINNTFYFPSLYAYVDNYTNEEKDYVRQFVGQRLLIYNHLDHDIDLSGNLGYDGNYGVSLALHPGEVGIFTCNIYNARKNIIDENSDKIEGIGWQVERIKFIK